MALMEELVLSEKLEPLKPLGDDGTFEGGGEDRMLNGEESTDL